MGIVVQKYGGSSVADTSKIHGVAAKVVASRRAGHDVVVVVSAMGKTTDQLLALAKEIDESPPRRELDMLLTTGERVSMALLSMAIQKLGVEAISFTGSQSGIITNDRHFDAKIIEVRPHRVEDELSRGKVVIIAGYQGMSYRREITTLGRGGSDTTALAMAAALGASHAEIYSDVDGVYTADPRVVADAAHLPELSYDEMQEMAEAGAKVLHAKAVAIAKEKGIAIHARSTFDPSTRETVVHAGVEPSGAVRGVVGAKGIARVSLADGGERVSALLRVLQDHGVVTRGLQTAGGRTSVLVVTGQTPDWARGRSALLHELGTKIEEGLGTVTTVGGSDATPLAFVSALEDGGIAFDTLEASGLQVTAVLREVAIDDAVRATHAALVR